MFRISLKSYSNNRHFTGRTAHIFNTSCLFFFTKFGRLFLRCMGKGRIKSWRYKSGKDSKFVNLNDHDFELSWIPISIPMFRPFETGSDERGWLPNSPPPPPPSPISCYYADHSQLSQDRRNVQSFNVSGVPKTCLYFISKYIPTLFMFFVGSLYIYYR
jgi:hypothetical protein